MNANALQSLGIVALLVCATVGVPMVAAAPSASFDKSEYQTAGDEPVTVQIQLQETENATVHLASQSGDFQMNVTVLDNTSDGQVSMDIYTERLGVRSAGNSVEVAGNDTVASSDGDTPGNPISAGDYNLTLLVDGNVTDNATLTIAEESTMTTTAGPTDGTTTGDGMTDATTGGDGMTDATTADDGVTDDPAMTDGDDTTTDGGTSGSPGFGLAVALAALVGVALLARRRT